MCYSLFYGPVAQRTERRAPDPEVGGSNPPRPVKESQPFFQIPSIPKDKSITPLKKWLEVLVLAPSHFITFSLI